MSDLLSAVFGAIIGGVLTLVGSVLVNGWETARTARLRPYDELIPKAEEPRLGFDPAEDLKYELAVDDVEAIRRGSVVAGCRELRPTNVLSEA